MASLYQLGAAAGLMKQAQPALFGLGRWLAGGGGRLSKDVARMGRALTQIGTPEAAETFKGISIGPKLLGQYWDNPLIRRAIAGSLIGGGAGAGLSALESIADMEGGESGIASLPGNVLTGLLAGAGTGALTSGLMAGKIHSGLSQLRSGMSSV